MSSSDVVVRSTKYRTLTSCATIPAPNPVNSPVARSNTSTSWPRVRSSKAVVNPPIEPPTIATRSALASTLCGIKGMATASGTHCIFVATTRADLVQLDHVTKRVVHEDLFDMRPNYAGQRPVFDAEPVQFALGLLHVRHRQCHMGESRILTFAFRVLGRTASPNFSQRNQDRWLKASDRSNQLVA